MVDYSYYAVLAAGLMPYGFVGVAKFGTGRRYNNHDPRAFLSGVEGKHRRALNAQHNSFEALPLFIGGVLIAHQGDLTPDMILTINLLSWGFIALRLLYGWAYIKDFASLRSVVWASALTLNLGLFFI